VRWGSDRWAKVSGTSISGSKDRTDVANPDET